MPRHYCEAAFLHHACIGVTYLHFELQRFTFKKKTHQTSSTAQNHSLPSHRWHQVQQNPLDKPSLTPHPAMSKGTPAHRETSHLIN